MIVQVVRCFDSSEIIHVAGKVDPINDIEVIGLELQLADLQMIENVLVKLEKQAKTNSTTELIIPKTVTANRPRLRNIERRLIFQLLLNCFHNQDQLSRRVCLPDEGGWFRIASAGLIRITDREAKSPEATPTTDVIRKLFSTTRMLTSFTKAGRLKNWA